MKKEARITSIHQSSRQKQQDMLMKMVIVKLVALYYARAKFCQCHYNNPQSNIIQQPRINFPESQAHLENSGKFAPRENNPPYGN